MKYTQDQLVKDAGRLAEKFRMETFDGIYGVPRGGIPLAAALSALTGVPMVAEDQITKDTLVVDDIIDSGATRMRYPDNYFAAIHAKGGYGDMKDTTALNYGTDEWVEYFWEAGEGPVQDNLVRVLQYIGEDPTREGLADTPNRIVRSWDKLFGGYKEDPRDILQTTFTEGSCNEMVILKGIEFYSTCEHHMIPFSGSVSIGYIPNSRVVGISKLARLVEVFARRLQIQERLSTQIADAIMDVLEAKGVMVVINAQHLCMTARGVEKQKSVMITSAIRGVFEQEQTRNEFLALTRD